MAAESRRARMRRAFSPRNLPIRLTWAFGPGWYAARRWRSCPARTISQARPAKSLGRTSGEKAARYLSGNCIAIGSRKRAGHHAFPSATLPSGQSGTLGGFHSQQARLTLDLPGTSGRGRWSSTSGRRTREPGARMNTAATSRKAGARGRDWLHLAATWGSGPSGDNSRPFSVFENALGDHVPPLPGRGVKALIVAKGFSLMISRGDRPALLRDGLVRIGLQS